MTEALHQLHMEVDIAGVKMKNPLTLASGTFSVDQLSQFDYSRLGAVTTKGVSLEPWTGNDTPRVCETAAGMLNAIGLQNPGIAFFLSHDLPRLREHGATVIVNVCGHTEEEYEAVVERLSDAPVDLLEINISCPNVKDGGIAFGQKPEMIEAITKRIKEKAKQPIIMKLSPNVTDIADCARAAEAGGADAVSLINTLLGMKIDIDRRDFALANQTGGLSGPAIKPIAVRMVYAVRQAVKIPIIGMGGIMTAADAIEFMMAGATMVAVGMAQFRDPFVAGRILDGMEAFCAEQGIRDICEIIGCVG